METESEAEQTLSTGEQVKRKKRAYLMTHL